MADDATAPENDKTKTDERNRTDSGRDPQPEGGQDVVEQREDAELLEDQGRPSDDVAGINPSRTQTSQD